MLDGREISVGELNERMKDQFLEEFLRQPEDRQYEMRESAVRELVQRHVVDAEAKKKGLTPEALFDEVTAAAAPVSVEDVSTWYKQNEARLRGARARGGRPADRADADPGAEERGLERLHRPEARGALLGAWCSRPRARSIEATKLVRGPADARVTLITFSDYQCPYCIRSEAVLADVLAKYPKDVRLVHRHFPLDQIHPFARPAAEAAMCADAQGRFWEFHDAIFALNGKIDEKSFGTIGEALGLDGKALATAASRSGRFKDYVANDASAGEAAGVTGTPAFFVNGIPLKGSRDVTDLSRVIDGELARLAASPECEARIAVRSDGRARAGLKRKRRGPCVVLPTHGPRRIRWERSPNSSRSRVHPRRARTPQVGKRPFPDAAHWDRVPFVSPSATPRPAAGSELPRVGCDPRGRRFTTPACSNIRPAVFLSASARSDLPNCFGSQLPVFSAASDVAFAWPRSRDLELESGRTSRRCLEPSRPHPDCLSYVQCLTSDTRLRRGIFAIAETNSALDQNAVFQGLERGKIHPESLPIGPGGRHDRGAGIREHAPPMGLTCGIVGLPNVGKSTLFNALTAAGIQAENYPFCTIEPNTGVVVVPDRRLDQLQDDRPLPIGRADDGRVRRHRGSGQGRLEG